MLTLNERELRDRGDGKRAIMPILAVLFASVDYQPKLYACRGKDVVLPRCGILS